MKYLCENTNNQRILTSLFGPHMSEHCPFLRFIGLQPIAWGKHISYQDKSAYHEIGRLVYPSQLIRVIGKTKESDTLHHLETVIDDKKVTLVSNFACLGSDCIEFVIDSWMKFGVDDMQEQSFRAIQVLCDHLKRQEKMIEDKERVFFYHQEELM